MDSCQDLGNLTEQRPGGQWEEFPPRTAHLAVLATGPRSGRQWSDGGAQVCTCLQARTHSDHSTSLQPTSKLLLSLSLWPVWVGFLPLQDRGPGTQRPSCQVRACPGRWICVWRTAFTGRLGTDPGSRGLTAPGTQITSGLKGEAFPQFGMTGQQVGGAKMPVRKRMTAQHPACAHLVPILLPWTPTPGPPVPPVQDGCMAMCSQALSSCSSTEKRRKNT